jgi:hypothetical protein
MAGIQALPDARQVGPRGILARIEHNPALASRVIWLAWAFTRGLLFLGMIAGRNFCDAEFYKYAGAFATGSLPYRNIAVEYPPLAIVLLLLPALPLLPFGQIAPRPDAATGAALVHQSPPDPTRFAAYGISFGVEMLIIDALTLVLVRWTARRYLAGDRYGTRASLLYIMLVFFSGALLQKFDLAAGALCLLAVVAAWAGRYRASGVALAAAVLVKGFPVLLLPALAFFALKVTTSGRHDWRERLRPAIEIVVAFGATIAVMTLAVVLVAGMDAVVHTITYHTGRQAEIESLYANLMLLLGWIPGFAAHTAFAVDGLSRVVISPLGSFLDPVSVILLVGLPVLVYIAYGWGGVVRALHVQAYGHERQRLAAVAVALMLAFIVAFRALPAHYVLALLPLVAITRLPNERLQRLMIAGFAAVAILGQILAVPPIWHALVVQLPWAVLTLTLRNVGWIVAYAALVVALWQLSSGDWEALSQENTYEGRRRPGKAAQGSGYPAP